MDTTLSLYRIFYTVAQCGSISAAARHLYISQPAISKSISNLENELQTHLFERTSRGVSLTEEGQLLFHHVSDAFHSLEAGEAELSRIRDMGLGHLTIGVSTTLFFLVFPWLFLITPCKAYLYATPLLTVVSYSINVFPAV